MSGADSLIRATLSRLGETERKRLMYAFESMMTEIIVLSDDTFVGCNMKYLDPYTITGSHGPWMVGHLKKRTT